jgi:BCD family chlorophyll transporter-like MFS transporter
MKFLQLAFKTLRLSIIRVGIGWMFALLTFNFNRVSIADLGAIAVIVTSLIGLHHFLAPFQLVWGRLADRYPLAGYRRTPYILLSALVGSLVFLALPSLAVGLGERGWQATMLALVLLVVFGLAMAANGTATFALIAEVTSERERGVVVAVTHTFLVLSAIISAGVAKQFMPVYDPAQMQALYNLTPFIAVGTTLLGVVGMERRISRQEHVALLSRAEVENRAENAFAVGLRLMRTNRQVRLFFAFVLLAIMGVFLQDTILEVFGDEVFGMTVGETNGFTQIWGGGVLLGMLLIGVLTAFVPLSKKLIATVGGLGTALGLGMVALSSLLIQRALIDPALLLMGFSVGLFNVGAMSMMMEMTVEGHTGLYMGLWGMAQGLGNGLANICAGALHTALIETQALVPTAAYGLIFGLEALVMVVAIALLRGISVQAFKELDYTDITTAMALDTA